MGESSDKAIHSKRKLTLIVLVSLIAVCVAAVVVRNRYKLSPDQPTTDTKDLGLSVWEWRDPRKFAAEDLDSYMSFANSQNITTIYINIGEIVDIYELPDPAEKTQKQNEFNIATRQYVQVAHQHGIDVHGLAGNVDWEHPDYRYLPLQIMDYVSAYNAQVALDERLDGMQFDIEVYNQNDFDTHKEQTLEDFIITVAMIQERAVELRKTYPQFNLGFAIPYWFDGESSNTPKIAYNSAIKPVTYHLFDILNTSTNGYVAIMDYRDKAEGNNGSIAHAQDEIRYAETQAQNVQVVVGQLVGSFNPKSTTFYEEDPEYFFAQLTLIEEQFKNSTNYGGLAIHDLESFKKFVEE